MFKRVTDTELRTLIALARLGEDANAGSIRQSIMIAGKRVSVAGIYAALDRLVALRLAAAWRSDPRPEPGGRGRWHYRLTADGRAWLRRARAEHEALWHDVPTGGGSR